MGVARKLTSADLDAISNVTATVGMIAAFASLIPGVDVAAIPIAVIAGGVSVGVDCARPDRKVVACAVSAASLGTGVAGPVLKFAVPVVTSISSDAAELWSGLVGTVGFLPQPGNVIYGWATYGN